MAVPQIVGLFVLFFTLPVSFAQVSNWVLDEEPITGMQELLVDPLEYAMQGLPFLMDYRGPVVDTSSTWTEEMFNSTLDSSLEIEEALRYYLPSAKSNISDQCKHDVTEIHNAFTVATQDPRLWSLLMVDSWGKLPDGLLSGNSMPLGMMEECTAIDVDDHDNVTFDTPGMPNAATSNVHFNATFKGKYCFVVHGTEDPWKPQTLFGSPAILGNLPNYIYSGSTYGTCMPDSCSSEDFKVSLEEVLPSGEVVRVVDCHTLHEELQWEPKDYAFVGLMGFIAFLVVVAAVVDLTINYLDAQELRKGPLRYLLVFSGYTNMSKIFHINTKASQGTISCLHSMRVLSMTWVVYCHQHSFVQYGSENPYNMRYMYNDLMAQTILGATPSVDTFFFLSGLLIAYSLLRNKDKMDLYGFFMFYVHRILRLMPPIAACCFFAATMARFFSSGPRGEVFSRFAFQGCDETWIYDVFFINNFYQKTCLIQTWYTSVDTQIYILLPLIFFPLMYYEKIGLIWLAFMTLVSFIIPTVLSHIYHIAIGSPELQIDMKFWFFLYTGTWSRMSPYLFGLWTGYIIYKTANKKVTMSKWQLFLGWMISWVLGLLVVYGPYPYNNITEDFTSNRLPAQPISDVYNGFSRGAWGLSLMWVVLACHYGYGGLINSFMSHPSWQPLSRLTYGMFLVSLTIQVLVVGSQYTLVNFDHLTVIIYTCGILFLSGIGACILSLLIEGPFMGLEKLLFK